jgi:hypothetical protein
MPRGIPTITYHCEGVACMQVLHQIVAHAGVNTTGVAPFHPEALKSVQAYWGGYNATGLTPDDYKALGVLREHFRKDQADLKQLVDMLYPQLNFKVQLES